MAEAQLNSNKTWKGVKTALNVLFYTVIALLLLYSVIVITSRGANDIPNIFGNGFLAVETDSMVGDQPDSFNPNDLIFVHILSDAQKANLTAGQVITFKDPALQGRLNTHRIIDVRNDGFIQTQGDNESQPDFYLLELDDIVAVYTGKIPAVGGFILFLQSQLGFALLVLLPIFLVLVYQGYILLNNIFAIKKDKLVKAHEAEKEQAKIELELEKERMRQELLEELKKETKKTKGK